jgi:DNA adenine methylase
LSDINKILNCSWINKFFVDFLKEIILIIQPAIKWSGSKRSQAKRIVALFPKEIDTYYEPFCGGCSVLFQLMVSDVKVKNFMISDLNNDLISLWKKIKSSPLEVSSGYEKLWMDLNKDDDIKRKKKYYFSIRDRFNLERNPIDFMFIMRTAVNGMPRYNKNGNFNTAFHVTRNGIVPNKLEKILKNWSELLNKNNVVFENISYEKIQSKEGDLLYLDPPYAGTKGMYYGSIDYKKMWGWLEKQGGKYLLSFDGRTTTSDMTYDVPEKLYNNHIYLASGNSSFRRIVVSSKSEYVFESLYKNY